MSYLENPLNQFSTYTYNHSLWMIRPESAEDLENNIKNGQAVLIADNSRDTRYNITSVEQIFAVSHSRVRNGFMSNFEIQMTEPNGATLFNKIQQSARQLGIPSHLKALYILEIKFIGRTPDNNSKALKPEFYYPITISTMDFNVKSEGTTYNMSATELPVQGYMYVDSVIKDQVTIEAATVGEFVSEFSRKLSKAEDDALLLDRNRIYRNEYVFEFADNCKDWLQWRFQALKDPQSAIGHSIVGEGAQAKLQIPVTNGSNIPDLFGYVLQLTEEYKRIVSSDGGFFKETASSTNTIKNLDAFPVVYKVYPEIRYLQFDPLANDYQKEIKYTLSKYIVPNLIVDPEMYKRGISNVGTQSARVKSYLQSGLMRKRYDYLYTGMNTEVINLDLQFDAAYYNKTPFGGGLFGDPDVIASKLGKDKLSVVARLAQSKQDLVNTQASLRQKEAQLAKNNAQISKVGQQASGALRQGDGPFGGLVNQGRQIQSQLEQLGFDIRVAQKNLSQAITDYEEEFEIDPSVVAHPLHFVADAVNDQDTYSVESDAEGARNQFGAIKSNLENSGDLINIELEIRGDPFWLGYPRSFDAVNTGGSLNAELANYSLGGNAFFLNVNLPGADPDGSGRRKPSPDMQISAIYQVNSVIARYQDGQFVMFLSASMDPGTNTPSAQQLLFDGDIGLNDGGIAKTGKNVRDRIAQAQEDALRRFQRPR